MHFVITMEDDVPSLIPAKQASGCQEKLMRGAKNAYTTMHLLLRAVDLCWMHVLSAFSSH